MRLVPRPRFPSISTLAILATVVLCACCELPIAVAQQNWLRFGTTEQQSENQSPTNRSVTAPPTLPAAAQEAAKASKQSTHRLRITIDGESPVRWFGQIGSAGGKLSKLAPLGSEWHSPGIAHIEADAIQVHGRVAAKRSQFDATFEGSENSILSIELATEGNAAPQRIELPLSAVLRGSVPRGIPGGTITVTRAPGDKIRLDTDLKQTVVTPGQTISLGIEAALTEVTAGTPLDLKVTINSPRGGKPLWDSGGQRVSVPIEGFAETRVEVPVPAEEGAYAVRVSAIRPAGLRKSFMPYAAAKPLAEREFQIVVFDAARQATTPSDWRPIVDLDPTASRWWDRMPEWVWLKRVPWVPRGPLGSGEAEVSGEQAGRFVKLPAAVKPAWQAYPIPVAAPGKPHIVEIEYPADSPQLLIVTVFDQDPGGKASAIGASASVAVSEWGTPAKATRTVRKLFWPKTNSPLLVLSNGDSDQPCRFGRIKVLSATNRVANVVPEGPRELLAHVGSPNLTTIFGTSYGGSPEHEDWQSYFELANRLAERVSLAGQTGAVVTVASSGGVLYPSNVLARQTGVDRGALVDGGVDLPATDPLELLLRVFDRRGLTVVPAIRFEAIISSPQQIGTFNSARAMLSAIEELRERYGHHNSFAGVAIDFTARTIERQELLDPSQNGTPNTAAITELLRTAGAKSNAAGKDRLIVLTHNLLTSKRSLPPRLGKDVDWSMLNLQQGIDLAAVGDMQNVTVATPRLGPTSGPLADNAAWLSVAEAANRHPAKVALIAGRTRTLQLESFRRASPFGANQTDATLTIVPADANALRQYATLASEGAPKMIIEGAEALPLTLDADLVGARQSLQQLARVGLDPKTAGRQPLVVRSVELEGESSLELANPSPWPVEADVTVRTPQACVLTELTESPSNPNKTQQFDAGQHIVKAVLEPFSFRIMRFSTRGVEPLGVRSITSDQASQQLESRLTDLRSRNLGSSRSFNRVVNPSFEQLASDGSLDGWQALAADHLGSVSLASGPAADGSQALRLTSRGGVIGVESTPFDAPSTGQLAMVFRVRADSVPNGGELRVTFHDPDSAGAASRTYATVLPSAKLAVNPGTWHPYVFAPDDLPLGSRQRLQVKFQLAGGGQVDIDHLVFYELLFPLEFLASQSAKQKLALVKTMHAAQAAYDDGRLSDCRQMLEGYWPRFIQAYTPLIESKAEQVAIEPVVQEQAKEESAPSVGERLKGYLPGFMRF